ncbi:MAG: pilus assembly protein [Oligoflexia bacterium]|nr:pilus assembly protein [Oligoflexia bacterium]
MGNFSRFDPTQFRIRAAGVSTVETAFVLPLLLALVFVIIDLSRYFGVQGVSSQGAQRGIDLAIKTVNLEGSSTDPDFVRARTRVIEEAAKLPAASLVRNWTALGSGARFVGFSGYSVKHSETSAVVQEDVAAILLRPGDECVSDKAGTLHCHPTVCPPANAACLALHPGARAMTASDTIENLLQSDPLVIEMPVVYRSLLPLPGLGQFNLTGLAAGYREILTSGAYARPGEDPPPLPSNTPTAVPPNYTPPPSPTPSPSPIPCYPACDSGAVLDQCANQNFSCARCVVGHCECSNDCHGLE